MSGLPDDIRRSIRRATDAAFNAGRDRCPDGAVEATEAEAALRSLLTALLASLPSTTPALPDDELWLREQLWLRHGHRGLYGDDGEMQCGECRGLDFKRDDMATIRRGVHESDLTRMARDVGETTTLPEGCLCTFATDGIGGVKMYRVSGCPIHGHLAARDVEPARCPGCGATGGSALCEECLRCLRACKEGT